MSGQRRFRGRLAAAGFVLAAGAVFVRFIADGNSDLARDATIPEPANSEAPAAAAAAEEASPSFIEAVRAAITRSAAEPASTSADRDEPASEFQFVAAIAPPELPHDNQRVSGAYQAIFASFLDELRALPDLALLELETADQEIDDELVDFILLVSGDIEAREDPVWSFSVDWQATRSGEGSVTASQLESSLRPIGELGTDVARKLQRFPFPPHETRLPDLVSEALDDSLPDDDRIDALDELRDIPRRFDFIGVDAGRMTAVAAVEIVVNAADPDIRSRVWRAMMEAGVDDPYLISPLIDSLLQDPGESVRAQAAKLLVRKFNDDQRVLAALDFTINNDESPKVKALARWEFLDESGRRDYVRTTLMNEDLAIAERLNLLVADLNDLPNYVELGTALSALSRAVMAVDERGDAATRIERESVDYQEMVPMLIDVLEQNENEQLRVTAASMLVRYSDDPDVRAALEHAATSDRSFMLRMALSRTLQF